MMAGTMARTRTGWLVAGPRGEWCGVAVCQGRLAATARIPTWLREAKKKRTKHPHFARHRKKLGYRSAPRWGRSSAGRAPHWQCGGQGFDPPRLHHPDGLLVLSFGPQWPLCANRTVVEGHRDGRSLAPGSGSSEPLYGSRCGKRAARGATVARRGLPNWPRNAFSVLCSERDVHGFIALCSERDAHGFIALCSERDAHGFSALCSERDAHGFSVLCSERDVRRRPAVACHRG